jgi:hypothetical protein
MINPGTSVVVKIDPGIGLTKSQTLNPLSPLEVGRVVSGGVEGDTVEASTLPQTW